MLDIDTKTFIMTNVSMTFRFHHIDSYMYAVIKLTYIYQVLCLNVYENSKPELNKEGIVVYMKQRCKKTGTVWILRPQTEEKILALFIEYLMSLSTSHAPFILYD